MSMTSTETIVIVDPTTKVRYRRGRFLGKGGFARCYEFTNITTGEVMAGKVVSKSGLTKPQHKAKMSQEISIHKNLKHPYIVKFFNFFEDELNIYIMLELCRKRSLMEMHKRRKALSVPEVRYFMKQIALACKHLHDSKIIHRDLKLGNLFINDDMDIKVGDFGLATELSFDGEKKKTICGTPNYIAPEILTKGGHSYEVDIWSLGCIMYTLLVGTPPFETKSLRETYHKIRKNDYNIPRNLDDDAKNLIICMLHPDAKLRPTPARILEHSFFINKYIPHKLPTSCLTMAPRPTAATTTMSAETRRPLTEANRLVPIIENVQMKKGNQPADQKPKDAILPVEPSSDYYISDLLNQLTTTMQSHPESRFTGQDEDAQDPALVPFVWISKWIDYADKYGLGYSFCDNSKGVAFTDGTHIMLLADELTMQYIDKLGNETFCSKNEIPKELEKKTKLLEYFITYMAVNLSRAGGPAPPRDGDEMAHVPHLRKWQRTSSAIVFHLTNGTVQINFFRDHTKIIMCPMVGAVSYIDEHKNFTVYKLKAIEQFGCSHALAERLRYAVNMIHKYLA